MFRTFVSCNDFLSPRRYFLEIYQSVSRLPLRRSKSITLYIVTDLSNVVVVVVVSGAGQLVLLPTRTLVNLYLKTRTLLFPGQLVLYAFGQLVLFVLLFFICLYFVELRNIDTQSTRFNYFIYVGVLFAFARILVCPQL